MLSTREQNNVLGHPDTTAALTHTAISFGEEEYPPSNGESLGCKEKIE